MASGVWWRVICEAITNDQPVSEDDLSNATLGEYLPMPRPFTMHQGHQARSDARGWTEHSAWALRVENSRKYQATVAERVAFNDSQLCW